MTFDVAKCFFYDRIISYGRIFSSDSKKRKPKTQQKKFPQQQGKKTPNNNPMSLDLCHL